MPIGKPRLTEEERGHCILTDDSVGKAGCTVGLSGRGLCGETPLKHVAWWNQKWGPQSAILSLRFPCSEDSREDKVKFVTLWRKKAYKGGGL